MEQTIEQTFHTFKYHHSVSNVLLWIENYETMAHAVLRQ